MIRCLAALVLVLGLGAAETAAEPRPLRLGLGLAEDAALDGSVVVVRSVEAASSAAALGLEPGDRLLTLAGQPVSTLASVAEIARGLQAGTALTATIERAGERRELSATAVETPRPAQLAARTRELDAAVATLREDTARDRALRLEEILLLLKQVQEELPKTVAAFKEQYPQGRFNISITIDIQSDVTHPEPEKIGE